MPYNTEAVCILDECTDMQGSRSGWCRKHYWRWRRHGDPLFTVKADKRFDEDFWQFVNVRSEDECWLWIGESIQKTGYAQYGTRLAHRVSWEITNGKIPRGMTIDHLCFVPLCMNPKHLEVVTLAENVRRMNMLNRGRCRKGHVIRGLEDVYIRPDNGRSMCRSCMQARQRKEVVPSLV